MPASHCKRMMMIKTWQPLGKDYLSTLISSVAKSTQFAATSCSTCCHLFPFDILISPKFRKQGVLQKKEVREDCRLLLKSFLLLYLVPAKTQSANKRSRMEINIGQLLVKKTLHGEMDTQPLIRKGTHMILSLLFFVCLFVTLKFLFYFKKLTDFFPIS